MEIQRVSWNSMKLCEIHVLWDSVISRKIIRKQPFVPEAGNSSKTYAFLHGSGAVRVLWEPEWRNSMNSTHFSKIPPFWWNVVKFSDFWCLGDGNLAFTRSTMKTQSILGFFRCLSRPDRYFSQKIHPF